MMFLLLLWAVVAPFVIWKLVEPRYYDDSGGVHKTAAEAIKKSRVSN